jgi:hypothetical protein
VAVNAMVMGSTVSNNGTGLSAVNAGATLRVGSSIITGNTTGVSGAGVQSYVNNQINGNTGGEAPNSVPGGLK